MWEFRCCSKQCIAAMTRSIAPSAAVTVDAIGSLTLDCIPHASLGVLARWSQLVGLMPTKSVWLKLDCIIEEGVRGSAKYCNSVISILSSTCHFRCGCGCLNVLYFHVYVYYNIITGRKISCLVILLFALCLLTDPILYVGRWSVLFYFFWGGECTCTVLFCSVSS